MGGAFFIFQLIIIAYFGLMFLFIIIGFNTSKKPDSGIKKARWIILLFTGPIGYIYIEDKWSRYSYEKRVAPARVLFDARCATAKEIVYKTANDVEGFFYQEFEDMEIKMIFTGLMQRLLMNIAVMIIFVVFFMGKRKIPAILMVDSFMRMLNMEMNL